jgi:hypothetical protein
MNPLIPVWVMVANGPTGEFFIVLLFCVALHFLICFVMFVTLLSIMWGLQHSIIEGVAFLLMQKGLGYNAAATAAKYSIAWGLMGMYVQFTIFYHTGLYPLVLYISWEIILLLFYTGLCVIPEKYLYRRPACYVYAQLWAGYRVLTVTTVILTYYNSTYAVGNCVFFALQYPMFAIAQPLITYRTLLRDSRWWQGLKINMGAAHYLRKYYQTHQYAVGATAVSGSDTGSDCFDSSDDISEEIDGNVDGDAGILKRMNSYNSHTGTGGGGGGLRKPNLGRKKQSKRRQEPRKSRYQEKQSQMITSPLQGLNVNLHSAQNLADTLDQIGSQNRVKLLNFAYIKLDTAKLLGQGSFSKVYRGQYKQQECAVKLIFTVDLTVDVINRVAAESQILSSLRHPNVIGIYGVAVLPPSVCILLEICYYGSLSDVIRGSKSQNQSSLRQIKKLNISFVDMLYLVMGCAR